MVLKTFLHGQMTEQIASQLRPKNGGKLQKVPFLKIVFCNIASLGDPKKRSHMKIKSKISYIGERNGILSRQMAEQLAVEVDVKNVTYVRNSSTQYSSNTLFGLDSIKF